MALATRLRSASHWSDPRVKPPYGAVEVTDEALHAGLVGAWLVNELGGPPVDLVQSRRSAFVGSPTWRTGTKGSALDLTALTHGVKFGTDIAAFKPTSVSIVVLTERTVANDGNNYILSSVASSTGYELAVAPGGGVLWWAVTTNFNTNNTTFTPVLNVPFHAVLSYNEAVGTRVYVNGLQVATDATTGALTYTGVHELRFGERADAQPGMIGRYYLALIYNRGLTAAEAMRYAATPYTDFRSIIRRRYFIFTPPAGAAENIFTQEHIGRGIGRGVLVGR